MSSVSVKASHLDRNPLSASEVLPASVYQRLRATIDTQPFRRLSNEPEIRVSCDRLCQSLHLNRFTGPARAILGGDKSHYYMHSIQSAEQEIEALLKLGISSVYLQLQPSEPGMPYRAIIDHFAAMVHAIRHSYGAQLFMVVDPQGICMGEDLRWGARTANGTIDAELTLDLLAEGAHCLAQSGIDAMVTIGRANFEAAVARSGLDRFDPSIELWAFSTNSETPNAYFDVTAKDIGKAETQQKLIVGNNSEMFLRALLDVAEGVDVMVQKPVENMQILFGMRQLIDGTLPLESVLSEPRVQRLIAANPVLFEGDPLRSESFKQRLARARLGGYEVSGTYTIFKHVEDRYSDNLAVAMLEEMYRNALFAAGDRIRFLIGRNMLWFADTRKRLGMA